MPQQGFTLSYHNFSDLKLLNASPPKSQSRTRNYILAGPLSREMEKDLPQPRCYFIMKLFFFKKGAQAGGANLGSFWFSFIFSL